MKMRMLAMIALMLAAPLLAADKPEGKAANAGFEKLKTLAGEWKGKANGTDDVRVTYRVVAGGSAVEEMLSHADMVTMYHVDGENLMLTHYCAAQNQPRMRAAAFKDGDDKLAFSFFDATNMPDQKAAHMHALTLTFRDADRIAQEWTHYNDGKDSGKVVIELERVK
jgi:hypothetical protein